MSITGHNLRKGKLGQSLSYPDIADLRQAPSFQSITAIFPFLPATISTNGEAQRYWGSLVSANYFDVVRPAFVLGRGFNTATDDRPGEPPAVVLSYRLWRSRFGGDAAIAGRSIELNRRKVTVVGVTGPGFQGTEAMFFSEFWLPFSMLGSLAEAGLGGDRLADRGGQWLQTAGRLRDGTDANAAAAETEVFGRRLRAAYPATNRDRAFHVERAGQVNPGLRRMLLVSFVMLLGVAILVLCTACANVANLLLARAAARQREIATRLAIGAGRGRLVRQLLTESVMLALLSGIGGYGLARFGVGGIGRSRLPLAMPVDLSVSLDYRVLLFCMTLASASGLIFGLVPALRATRPDLMGALKDAPANLGRLRRLSLRNLLVVAQVGICAVLLVCSGLFLRSLYSARNMDTGISQRNLLMMSFDPSLNRYSRGETQRIVDAILDGADAIPGVESATLTSSVPLSMEGTQNAFVPEGETSENRKNAISADIYSVAPRFFETFGIRIIDGEDYRPGMPAEDVVIVNRTAAGKAFPGRNPIGRRILYFGRSVRVVGMVATAKSRTIGEDPRPCLYFPMARDLRGNDSLTGMTLVLRTRGNPAGYALALVLSRMAATLLYGVSPRDTLTFVAVPALLLAVALLTSLVPARRAASLDPIRALRYE